MIELGFYSLIASLLLCSYGTVAAVAGGRRGFVPLIRSAENCAGAHLILTATAALCLWWALLTDQFQLQYVAQNSSVAMPTIYKFSALWGGQAGSLLLWALILSLFSCLAVYQNRNRHREVMPYATGVLLATNGFFMLLLNFSANPFEILPSPPPDGHGLNPLLQNYWMMIHPPTLYLGYIGLTVPFAFAMGALMSGRLDASWIRMTRRWSMVAWIFLTTGITLGGLWAYETLGWGGYWAWDPVENASLLPWLAATAFLHSVMITEKKGMLKIWNFVLILLAFELVIFGTFITRSGVISSVHSFALSNIGPFFVGFLATSTFFGLFWIFYRSSELRSEQRMRSFLSREATFLLNNLLFLAVAFAVFWGTVFPIVSEAVQGEKITISVPFFNKVGLPLAFSLLVLTGICPLIAWRKASARNFRRNFLYPVAGGLASGILVVILFGVREWIPLLFFTAAGFVVLTIFFEFYKGARARQTIRPTGFLVALKDLTLMNTRRYGGFIIHAGAVIFFVGIIASSFYATERFFTVKEGESFVMKDYRLEFQGLRQRSDPEKDVVTARLSVVRGDREVGFVQPEKHFFHKGDQPMSEVAIRSRLREDLYVVLSGWDDNGVTFHVYVNPLVMLVWIGVAVMILGGLFVLVPDRRPAPAAQARRAEEEVRDEAA